MGRKRLHTDEEKKELKRQYYLKNREHFLELNRQNYRDNKERWKSTPESLEKRRARRAQNVEHYRIQSREYYRRDPLSKEKSALANRKGRAKNPERCRLKARQKYRKNRNRILAALRKRYATDEAFRKLRLAQSSRWQKQHLGMAAVRNRKSYYKDHERTKSLSRRKYRGNLEKRRESLRRSNAKRRASGKLAEWIARNRSRLNQQWLRRYHSEPGVKEYYASLRLRKKQPMIEKLCKVEGVCYICGMALEASKLTIDHVTPRTRGGGNEMSNLMPVHGVCNTKKSNRLNYPVVRPDLVRVS